MIDSIGEMLRQQTLKIEERMAENNRDLHRAILDDVNRRVSQSGSRYKQDTILPEMIGRVCRTKDLQAWEINITAIDK